MDRSLEPLTLQEGAVLDKLRAYEKGDGYTYVSQRTLAGELDLSERSVWEILHALDKKRRTVRKRRKQASSLIFIVADADGNVYGPGVTALAKYDAGQLRIKAAGLANQDPQTANQGPADQDASLDCGVRSNNYV